jgi:hypothetical protein
MIETVRLWAFIGLFAGIWKLAVLMAAVAALLWKTGAWSWLVPRRWPSPAMARPWRRIAAKVEVPELDPDSRRAWLLRHWRLVALLSVIAILAAWSLSRLQATQSTPPAASAPSQPTP